MREIFWSDWATRPDGIRKSKTIVFNGEIVIYFRSLTVCGQKPSFSPTEWMQFERHSKWKSRQIVLTCCKLTEFFSLQERGALNKTSRCADRHQLLKMMWSRSKMDISFQSFSTFKFSISIAQTKFWFSHFLLYTFMLIHLNNYY